MNAHYIRQLDLLDRLTRCIAKERAHTEAAAKENLPPRYSEQFEHQWLMAGIKNVFNGTEGQDK